MSFISCHSLTLEQNANSAQVKDKTKNLKKKKSFKTNSPLLPLSRECTIPFCLHLVVKSEAHWLRECRLLLYLSHKAILDSGHPS